MDTPRNRPVKRTPMNSPDDIVQAAIDGQMLSVPRWMADLAQQPPITLTIDGKKVAVPKVSVTADPKGKAVPRFTTIYDAAKQAGIDDPHPLSPRIHDARGRVPGLFRPGRLRGPAGRVAPRPRLLPAGRGGHDRQHAPHQRPRALLGQGADRAADGRPPHALRQAQGHRRLRAGSAGRQAGAEAGARAQGPRTPAARRLVAGDRRRSQRLHPVRSLQSAAATTSATTRSSAAWARATRPRSPST